MTDQNKNSKTYREQASEVYNRQYENWVPWMEDKYLSWFTKDNKTSYATKQQLDKSKVTGISQVDTLQDGVNGLVSGQVGKGGIAQPVGDYISKEGVNRAERGGKDDQGRSLDSQAPLGGYGQGAMDGVKNAGGGVAGGVKGAGESVTGGAKSAGGYLGGMWGGGDKGGDKK
ncbi:hypothetical protein BDV95DRAFT_562047 [Massariosphaeria phaeospora]|uniref:Uncharacterized protein n=1 Tax=Massariosphaeria phaeospora TaxID=100035 RepID=A0A7C8IFE7_9PLEO|nr:hypothetical protein BDV95DRAFT_562047 [Massariosphaeria phaeospora]